MDKFLKYFMMILMVSAVVLAGCSKDDDDEPTPTPTETSFEVLTKYMTAQNMGFSEVFDGWVIQDSNLYF